MDSQQSQNCNMPRLPRGGQPAGRGRGRGSHVLQQQQQGQQLVLQHQQQHQQHHYGEHGPESSASGLDQHAMDSSIPTPIDDDDDDEEELERVEDGEVEHFQPTVHDILPSANPARRQRPTATRSPHGQQSVNRDGFSPTNLLYWGNDHLGVPVPPVQPPHTRVMITHHPRIPQRQQPQQQQQQQQHIHHHRQQQQQQLRPQHHPIQLLQHSPSHQGRRQLLDKENEHQQFPEGIHAEDDNDDDHQDAHNQLAKRARVGEDFGPHFQQSGRFFISSATSSSGAVGSGETGVANVKEEHQQAYELLRLRDAGEQHMHHRKASRAKKGCVCGEQACRDLTAYYTQQKDDPRAGYANLPPLHCQNGVEKSKFARRRWLHYLGLEEGNAALQAAKEPRVSKAHFDPKYFDGNKLKRWWKGALPNSDNEDVFRSQREGTSSEIILTLSVPSITAADMKTKLENIRHAMEAAERDAAARGPPSPAAHSPAHSTVPSVTAAAPLGAESEPSTRIPVAVLQRLQQRIEELVKENQALRDRLKEMTLNR